MSDVAVQKAIYTLLNNGMSVPVYDSVPQGTSYPYCTIDNESIQQEDHLDTERERHFIYLSFWSTYEGQKEIKEMMAEAKSAIHRARPELDSGRIVGMWMQERDVRLDSDGQTYIGSMTVVAIVAP